MKPNDKLWRGVFSYSCEIERCFAYAKDEKKAKAKMLFQLAKKHQVNIQHVYALFDGSKQNFNIEIDREWKEKQNAM